MTALVLLPAAAVLLVVVLAGWTLHRGLNELARVDAQFDEERARVTLYPPLGRHGLGVPVEHTWLEERR